MMNTTPDICILSRFLYVMFASTKTASIDGFQPETCLTALQGNRKKVQGRANLFALVNVVQTL
jgi:hypothetical protein